MADKKMSGWIGPLEGQGFMRSCKQ